MNKENIARSSVFFFYPKNISKVDEKIIQRNVSPFFENNLLENLVASAQPFFFSPGNYFKVDDKKFKGMSVRPFFLQLSNLPFHALLYLWFFFIQSWSYFKAFRSSHIKVRIGYLWKKDAFYIDAVFINPVIYRASVWETMEILRLCLRTEYLHWS